MTDDEDEWDPEPAELRGEETPDISGHTAISLDLIDQAEELGIISEEQAERSREKHRKGEDDEA